MSLHFEFSSGRVADSRFCASFCYPIQGGIAPLVYGRGACRVVSVGAARRCGISRSCRLPDRDFCAGFFPGRVFRARLASSMIVGAFFPLRHCIKVVRGMIVTRVISVCFVHGLCCVFASDQFVICGCPAQTNCCVTVISGSAPASQVACHSIYVVSSSSCCRCFMRFLFF